MDEADVEWISHYAFTVFDMCEYDERLLHIAQIAAATSDDENEAMKHLCDKQVYRCLRIRTY